MKKIEFQVTSELIEMGDRCSSINCPVALAIARKLAPGWRVEVDRTQILLSRRVSDRKVEFHYRDLPMQARSFVRMFDEKREKRPFAFAMEVPEACFQAQ